jgi:hypothetical protein
MDKTRFDPVRRSGDAELGVLELDQVMQLDAGFLFPGIVAVKDGVTAGLGFVEVFD